MKRPITTTSSPRDSSAEATLTRMDPVLHVTNEAWSFSPENRHRNALQQNMEIFWAWKREETENFTGFPVSCDRLPLARIKRVMKSDPQVKSVNFQTVSSEAPVIFAKAYTQLSSRQTIRTCDIADAVRNSELHDYLDGLVNFDKRSISHQAVPERALHQQMFSPANMNLSGTEAPTDMDQIQKDNLMADRFINTEEFELNHNLHVVFFELLSAQ
ncbi:hypothetical protein EUTSA_v10028056mg [Eutrema salsugineum]|uniref:Transcription factor CBF/NF-Y/archaeal histone domain-containing protein n=1 Tax=Eutrema salsugineum TaxID=72664 RepID=V4NLG3_EUTSA|nr:hypothetical protein EUTSA_v10028056mg [Eutrema salsugineum]